MHPFMTIAVEAARKGMETGAGGPFGADWHDAAVGGFDNAHIYRLAEGVADSPLLRPVIVDQKECAELFDEWNAKSDRTMY